MNKQIVFGLFVGLVILILLTIFLPLFSKPKIPKKPHLIPLVTNQPPGLATGLIDQSTREKLNQTLPYETDDFKVEYSPVENKIVATAKTPSAEKKIDDWLTDNNLNQIKNNPEIFIIKKPTPTPFSSTLNQSTSLTIYPTTTISIMPTAEANAQLLVDLLSILLQITVYPSNNNQTSNQPSAIVSPTIFISPSSKKSTTPKPTKTKQKSAENYVYYAQCGGSYDNYPLPSGCTVCEAGCGPTTVAMIVASYVDKSVTPKTIVDLYDQKGYLLGCAGSRYSDAKAALAGYGLKTSDYFISSYSNPQTIDQVASEMKNYLANGWTIFTLANFCDEGCGHFFWITDVSAGNDTWAYDPYYGRNQPPPYNEKTRYPFPKYKIAFGVKK